MSESSDALLERIRSGPPQEQQAAIDALVRRAHESDGDPDAWGNAGMGFFEAGRYDDAISVFRQLVEALPHADHYRLNLATAYSQTQNIELCRHHLQYVVEHGSTEEFRRIGREQLEAYEDVVGLGPKNEELRELQIRSLREATSRGATPEDYVTLAKILLKKGLLTGDPVYLTQTVDDLEAGLGAFPKHAGILELLAGCYLRRDPNGRLGEVMRQLEQVNPESEVFRIVEQTTSQKSSAFRRDMMTRVNGLVQQAGGESAEERKAAVFELHRIVALFPDNPSYRLNYAFALAVNGAAEAALDQGRTLAAYEIAQHEFQFNLGQVFWLSGDTVNGRHHLELAIRFAETDEERHDALERIASLERRHEPS